MLFISRFFSRSFFFFFFCGGTESHNFQPQYHSFWGSGFFVPDILSQSVYVILFFIFYKRVSDMSVFFTLVWG